MPTLLPEFNGVCMGVLLTSELSKIYAHACVYMQLYLCNIQN